jgi:outer membrane protein OmpA-like peptidoglycan-associated protein/tetratricopeptide (TPR) repeat protein
MIMLRIKTLALLLAVPFVALTQPITKNAADNKFETHSFAEAIPLYEELLRKEPDVVEYQLKLAECYRRVKNYREANRLYSILAHHEAASAKILWHYAQSLAQVEKYEEAADWYDKYAKLEGSDPIAKTYSSHYRNLASITGDSVQYDINFLYSINSWQSDFSPALLNNGMVFCSGRTYDGPVRRVSGYDNTSLLKWYFVSDTSDIIQDLEIAPEMIKRVVDKSKNMGDDYSQNRSNDSPIPGYYAKTFLFDSVQYTGHHEADVKKLNSSFERFHVGPACFVDSATKVFFTANDRRPVSKIDRLVIYSADVRNGKFKKIQKLPMDWPGYSSGHPAYSGKERRLYFTSNQPDGKGGTDIYYSDYHEGVWSVPTNLEAINTPGNESFPYVDALGNLYFSSDYHPGLGGLDIFKAVKSHGEITSIEHLDYPINSSKDDFGITLTEDLMQGYLSSNRKRGFSDDDIYYFKKTCKRLNIKVIDDETELPLASVKLSSSLDATESNEDGLAMMCLQKGDSLLTAELEGYEMQEIYDIQSPLEIRLRPLAFSLQGIVVQDHDQQLIDGALIELTDLDDPGSKSHIITDASGQYNFDLKGNRTYSVTASKERCGTSQFELPLMNLTQSMVFNKNIVMLCEGDIVEMDEIYYDLNKATLTSSAIDALDDLIILMKKYPDMRIELRSHTDSRGSKDFNMSLSARRAQSVVDHLVKNGIVPFRLRAVGLGESEPVNDCTDLNKCPEAQYQANRRTEFRVLSINDSDINNSIISDIK